MSQSQTCGVTLMMWWVDEPRVILWRRVVAFADRNQLLLALIGAVLLGIGTYHHVMCVTASYITMCVSSISAWPQPGVLAATKSHGQSPVQTLMIVLVFFASGLKLKVGDYY